MGVLLLVLLAGPAAPSALRTGPPAWAADAVWYEIPPERFRNGDPRNDPRSADLRPPEPPPNWVLSSWTSDWFARAPWEKASEAAFYATAPHRRYGGDLQGVLDKLDHIQSLGVNVIVLNPVFEAPSASRRDATLLHHVDNNLGPEPETDRLVWATENPADPSTWKWTAADKLLLRLVQECHRRQIKVVLDGVFGRVGPTFWALRDARARGASSRYAAWFQSVDADRPELRRDGDTLAAGPREHLRAIVRRWGDPNGDGDPVDGIDGWRVEAPETLGRGFLRDLRRWVLGLNPQAVLVGELMWQDRAGGRMWNPAPWLRGDQLDAATNYRVADLAKAFFIDRQGTLTAGELQTRLATLRSEQRDEVAGALVNTLDSHATDRLASQIVNRDRPYGRGRSAAEDPKYEVRAPSLEEGKRLRLLAAFQFAYLGAPSVYYGTEAGMWGGEDPDNGKPMVWRELRYDAESAHPLGQSRRADPVRFDEDLYKYYQTLGRLRAALPALRRGSLDPVLADDARKLYGFVRVEEDRVVAAFNASEKDQTVELPVGGPVRDVLSSRRFRPKEGRASVLIPALSAVILAPDER